MILHLILLDKFIPAFIDFLEEHLPDFDRHLFLIKNQDDRLPVRSRPNVRVMSALRRPERMRVYLEAIHAAERIVLHGLYDFTVIRLLAIQPWVLARCYWAIWGGDLHNRNLTPRSLEWAQHELLRRWVIPRLGHLISFVEGDVDLARQWYGARGQYHECLMYPSNLFQATPLPARPGDPLGILIGNSAAPSNEHLEILDLLRPYRDEDLRIVAPLSYGDRGNAAEVARVGAQLFGSKFVALTELLPFVEYQQLLARTDIAIFNHRRQQALGNIITLLGLGKKVYLRREVSTWPMLERLGLTLFDPRSFRLERLGEPAARRNAEIIQARFSKEVLVAQLRTLFDAPDRAA